MRDQFLLSATLTFDKKQFNAAFAEAVATNVDHQLHRRVPVLGAFAFRTSGVFHFKRLRWLETFAESSRARVSRF